jgi:DNA-directed RNA polymerase specialized sigma24 family protein
MTIKAKKKIKAKKSIDKRYVHSSERSPYWDDYAKRREGNEEPKELAQANPDVLREDEAMYADSQPSNPRLLLGEAVQHLQGRQKEVYLLTMREGKSLAEAAEVLGIEKGSAQVYRDRAIKFLTKYCEEAIKKGRV